MLYFRSDFNSYTKNTKAFTSKSNWVPPLKSMDPDLLECINNFTDEIENLQVLKKIVTFRITNPKTNM